MSDTSLSDQSLALVLTT